MKHVKAMSVVKAQTTEEDLTLLTTIFNFVLAILQQSDKAK